MAFLFYFRFLWVLSVFHFVCHRNFINETFSEHFIALQLILFWLSYKILWFDGELYLDNYRGTFHVITDTFCSRSFSKTMFCDILEIFTM